MGHFFKDIKYYAFAFSSAYNIYYLKNIQSISTILETVQLLTCHINLTHEGI